MTLENWANKRVFITGATGFIGSHLAEALVNAGADVVVLVRDIVPKSYFSLSGLATKVTQVMGKLQDYSLLRRCLHEYDIEYCFHLGALATVPVANRLPLLTFESNILGTWNILEAIRNSAVKGLVVASSDKAYGIHKKLPYTEDYQLKGCYPYDVSKVCAEHLTKSYFHTYNLPVAITRLGNVYGGGDLNFSRIIPGTIVAVLRNQPPVIRSDGTPKRDYLYIKDAVSAYKMLGENLDRKSVHGQAFNFGTETPISVLDLVNLILRLTNHQKLEPRILGRAKSEIPEQYLSYRKAEEMLGWVPQYKLEHGLRDTISWYKERVHIGGIC